MPYFAVNAMDCSCLAVYAVEPMKLCWKPMSWPDSCRTMLIMLSITNRLRAFASSGRPRVGATKYVYSALLPVPTTESMLMPTLISSPVRGSFTMRASAPYCGSDESNHRTMLCRRSSGSHDGSLGWSCTWTASRMPTFLNASFHIKSAFSMAGRYSVGMSELSVNRSGCVAADGRPGVAGAKFHRDK